MLGIVLKKMEDNEKLWELFFRDFITLKFHLNPEYSCTDINQEDVTYHFIYQCFKFIKQYKLTQKIAYLYCHHHEFQLQISRMATLLKPLSNIQKVINYFTA